MNRGSGFTLIELLVVMVIIGITATTIAVATVRGDDPERPLQRLRQVLERVAEKAEVSGTPIAVDFLPGGYRFNRFDTRGHWIPLVGDSLFEEQRLDTDLAWHGLELEGVAVPPRLVFASTMPAFVLRVATSAGDARLIGKPTGSVVLVKGDEEKQ
jgi:general secretion pathway protein H